MLWLRVCSVAARSSWIRLQLLGWGLGLTSILGHNCKFGQVWADYQAYRGCVHSHNPIWHSRVELDRSHFIVGVVNWYTVPILCMRWKWRCRRWQRREMERGTELIIGLAMRRVGGDGTMIAVLVLGGFKRKSESGSKMRLAVEVRSDSNFLRSLQNQIDLWRQSSLHLPTLFWAHPSTTIIGSLKDMTDYSVEAFSVDDTETVIKSAIGSVLSDAEYKPWVQVKMYDSLLCLYICMASIETNFYATN